MRIPARLNTFRLTLNGPLVVARSASGNTIPSCQAVADAATSGGTDGGTRLLDTVPELSVRHQSRFAIGTSLRFT